MVCFLEQKKSHQTTHKACARQGCGRRFFGRKFADRMSGLLQQKLQAIPSLVMATLANSGLGLMLLFFKR